MRSVTLPHGERLRGPQTPDELDLLKFMPLAVKWAGRWRNSFDDFDEALQVAYLGLLKARDKWEPRRGPFGVIAVWYIQEALNAALYHQQRQDGRAPADTTRLVAKHRRDRKVIVSKHPSYRIVSANTIRADGEPIDILEQIADDTPSPEAALSARQEADALKRRAAAALAKLDPRERRIIRARCMAEEKAVLETLSKEMGVSRERIRQLEVRALSKVGAALGSPEAARTPPNRRKAPAMPSGGRQRPPRAYAWEKDEAGRWLATAWR